MSGVSNWPEQKKEWCKKLIESSESFVEKELKNGTVVDGFSLKFWEHGPFVVQTSGKVWSSQLGYLGYRDYTFRPMIIN